MASDRDQKFQAWYESLSDKGGIGAQTLMRKAWEAGRRYEVERIEAIIRPKIKRSRASDA